MMGQRSIEECNAAVDAKNNLINNGSLEIRSGAPGDIDSAPTGSVLITFPLPATVFNNAVTRTATANTVNKVVATAGNAGGEVHYLVKNSNGDVERNGTAGLSGSGANMILQTLTWNAGQEVSITGWTNTEQKGSN